LPLLLWGAIAAAVLTACASAPTHFLTLVPMADGESAAILRPSSLQVESVAIPAEIDQPFLLVRESDGSVALIETERWIAPLSDQIRSSLNLALARRASQATGAVQPLRIRIAVLRFDAVPDRYALFESTASLSLTGKPDATLECGTRLRVAVAPGYPALAEGFQTAIDELADALSREAASLRDGNGACG